MIHTTIRLTRPFTLLPPLLGMLSGSAAALGAGVRVESWSLAAVRIGLGALMAATLNAASNVLNQIHDVALDRVNKPTRPLSSGAFPIPAARFLTAVFYGAAAVMAYFVAPGGSRECFAIVLVTCVLTWAYSAPPLRLRRNGFIANATIALPRGMLLKVAGWSAVAPVFSDLEPWYIGAIFMLFLLGASTTKDFSDMSGDSLHGVRTLPVIFGVERTARGIGPFFSLPWLLLGAGVLIPHPVRSGPLLRAAILPALVLTGILFAHGRLIARLLLRDPASLAGGGNHPAWTQMYLQMMIAQVGVALCYWL